MINFLICLILSNILAYCLSILFVEKGKDFPIKRIRILIQNILHKIYWKLPQMFYCTTCLSFHTSLVSDIIICIIALYFGVPYFFWPFSGIISSGMTWTIMEFLNSREQHIEIINNVEK